MITIIRYIFFFLAFSISFNSSSSVYDLPKDNTLDDVLAKLRTLMINTPNIPSQKIDNTDENMKDEEDSNEEYSTDSLFNPFDDIYPSKKIEENDTMVVIPEKEEIKLDRVEDKRVKKPLTLEELKKRMEELWEEKNESPYTPHEDILSPLVIQQAPQTQSQENLNQKPHNNYQKLKKKDYTHPRLEQALHRTIAILENQTPRSGKRLHDNDTETCQKEKYSRKNNDSMDTDEDIT